MTALWGEVLLEGGAVQHVRIPVRIVTVPAGNIDPSRAA